MRITVFGGSSPQPGEPAYQEAEELGKLLGEAKHTVLTGGYIGTMEAVSKGCAEAGGYVIGVTCDEIETWRPVQPNKWVQKELRFTTLRERLFTLIEACDAAMALPGGVGTLAEVSIMWNHMQTDAIPVRPLILIGNDWRGIFVELYTKFDPYFSKKARDLVYFADDPEYALKFLNQLKAKKPQD
jgi:hypothetical protein